TANRCNQEHVLRRYRLQGSGVAEVTRRARIAALIGRARAGQAATMRARSGSRSGASLVKARPGRTKLSSEVIGMVAGSVARAADCKSALPGSNPGGAFHFPTPAKRCSFVRTSADSTRRGVRAKGI